MNRIAKALFRTWCGPVAAWLAASTASAQDFAIDPIRFASFPGTSTDGNFAVSGVLTKAGGGPLSSGTFSVTGEFVGLVTAVRPLAPATTIFDNTGGGFNGQESATPTTWLANKFCLGPQSYTLDSVALSLFSRDPGTPTVVRLQIYADDPVTGKPSVSTGLMMNLSGWTNPITFTVVASTTERLITWKPATPFILSANRCYWAVLSVDNGEVLQAASSTMPTGAAASFGRASSTDAGATWGGASFDNTSNRKMLIRGTAGPAPQPFAITAINLSGDELRLSFPGSSGQSYVIESRTEMTAGEWATVPSSSQVGTGGTLEVSAQLPAGQPQQFYRVRQLP